MENLREKFYYGVFNRELSLFYYCYFKIFSFVISSVNKFYFKA